MAGSNGYNFEDFVADLEVFTSFEQDLQERIRKISRRMKILLGNQEDFLTSEELAGKRDNYARHLVHADRKRKFIVVSIVWEPGQGTPIHDHGTWGVAGVVSNELGVTNYSRLDDRSREGYAELKESMHIIAPPGTITHVLPPDEEIHSMQNKTSKTTVSLHVYGQEIYECNMFDIQNKTYKRYNLAMSNVRGI